MGGSGRLAAVLAAAVWFVALGVWALTAQHSNAGAPQTMMRSAASPPAVATAVAPPVTAPPVTVAPAPPTASRAAPAPVGRIAPKPVAAASQGRNPVDVGNEALGLIRFPFRERLNVSIAFSGPRSGARAHSTANPGHDEVIVYVRPNETAKQVAVTIAHEIGHLLDYHHLTDADRQAWLSERGASGTPWWTCDYCNDYATGSGDYAETFAAWAVAPIDFRSEVAPLPSPAQLQSLSRFFR